MVPPGGSRGESVSSSQRRPPAPLACGSSSIFQAGSQAPSTSPILTPGLSSHRRILNPIRKITFATRLGTRVWTCSGATVLLAQRNGGSPEGALGLGQTGLRPGPSARHSPRGTRALSALRGGSGAAHSLAGLARHSRVQGARGGAPPGAGAEDRLWNWVAAQASAAQAGV